jgi:hypothetical protein
MSVYVLSDSKQQFADWCAAKGVNPLAAVCVLDPFSLVGKVNELDRVIDARISRRITTLEEVEAMADIHSKTWQRPAPPWLQHA